MDPLAAPDPPGNVPGGDTFMWMFTSAAESVGDWWSDKSPASTWGSDNGSGSRAARSGSCRAVLQWPNTALLVRSLIAG